MQGRHVSENMYFQGDDSELEECGRGCKQHDPSGCVPPHVIAHYSGRLGIRARPYYNRQGKAAKSTRRHSVAHARAICGGPLQTCRRCILAAPACTLIYAPLLFKHTQE